MEMEDVHLGEDCINDKGSEATWGKSLQKPNEELGSSFICSEESLVSFVI